MQVARWCAGGVIGLLVSVGACAQTAVTATPRDALAPTGTLRVAMPTGSMFASRDTATGELKGPAIDIVRELASQLGTAYEARAYPNPGAIIAAAETGEWDVALMNMAAQNAGGMHFSAPYMEVQQSFIVGSGGSIVTLPDLDKTGVRVAVLEKSGTDAYLSRTLKSATLVRVKSGAEITVLWESGKVDAIAASIPALLARAAKLPGSRVLDVRFTEPVGMAIPRARGAAAAAYVASFVEEAKANGLIERAIKRAGTAGVIVAPRK